MSIARLAAIITITLVAVAAVVGLLIGAAAMDSAMGTTDATCASVSVPSAIEGLDIDVPVCE